MSEPAKRRLVLPAQNAELRIILTESLQISYAGMSPEAIETQEEIKKALSDCCQRIKTAVRKLPNRDEAQLVAGLQQVNSALPAFLTAVAAHDLVEPKKS